MQMHHIHNFLFTFVKPICLTVSEPLIVVNKPRFSFVGKEWWTGSGSSWRMEYCFTITQKFAVSVLSCLHGEVQTAIFTKPICLCLFLKVIIVAYSGTEELSLWLPALVNQTPTFRSHFCWSLWLICCHGDTEPYWFQSRAALCRTSHLVLHRRHDALLAVIQMFGEPLDAVAQRHGDVALVVQGYQQAGHLLQHLLWCLREQSTCYWTAARLQSPLLRRGRVTDEDVVDVCFHNGPPD